MADKFHEYQVLIYKCSSGLLGAQGTSLFRCFLLFQFWSRCGIAAFKFKFYKDQVETEVTQYNRTISLLEDLQAGSASTPTAPLSPPLEAWWRAKSWLAAPIGDAFTEHVTVT